ncbi:methylase [Paenibacillus sp. GCM10027629]|uniref:methylase n=1 Tax=Paenibacillus sp. GCM10027629 TaxID=3273414 RepID=UPI0036318C70
MSFYPAYEQQGVAMTCRSYEEYMRMFALTEADLAQGTILDVAGGASSFTAEVNSRGYTAVAADPIFHYDAAYLARYASEEIETSTAKLTKIQETFDWSFYGDPAQHRDRRIRSSEQFIADYQSNPSHYIFAKLPELPFDDHTFQHVFCSHFLFLYADQFDYAFHISAIKELIRVCAVGGSVLIYPLKSLRWAGYPAMSTMMQEFEQAGHQVSFKSSQLPFIPGSSDFLEIKKIR